MMLTRIVRSNCENYDLTKQILIWFFKERKKFHTSSVEQYCDYDFDKGNSWRNYNNNPRHHRNRQSYDRYDYDYNRRNRDRFSMGGDSLLRRDLKIDWSAQNLKPVVKDFYKPHPDVLNRSPEEIKKFYEENDIHVSGEECPPPILNFQELNLPVDVNSYISRLEYSEPTPIQALTWPVALSGKNMVGISRTGSGKTLAFVLPALIHILNQSPVERDEGPIALVLAPTRELVQQIHRVTDPLVKKCGLYATSLFGGSSKMAQFESISRKNEMYVATPGRLLDFLNSNTTNMNRCTYVVIDEADQMLDMGFEPQVRSIMNYIRPDRQILMWSATWPTEIQTLADDFLEKFVKLQVGSAELTVNPNITQIIHVCEEHEKLQLLKNVLNDISAETNKKTLIFVQTKFGVERVGRFLNAERIFSKTLHGDHSQAQRNRIMNDFRSGRIQYLVATNVAGRGLDVKDVRFIINYDFPQTINEYIHKIGRTGRSNNSGTAHSFFTPENASLTNDLITVLESTNQVVSPELSQLSRGRRRTGMYHRHQAKISIIPSDRIEKRGVLLCAQKPAKKLPRAKNYT